MILLWGLPADPPLARVQSALCRREAPVALIDQRDVLETDVELCVDGAVSGVVHTPHRVIPRGVAIVICSRVDLAHPIGKEQR